MTTEVNMQLVEHPPTSAKIEPKSEKKLGLRPKSHENGRLQKELVVPEMLEFTPIQKEPKSLSTYRFGNLSHHSFFSRHHPHPQHMGHIQDLAGNRVCTVREVLSYTQLPHHSNLGCFVKMPHLSTPVGDPQSNREPLLFSEAWKKELKELSSQLTISTTHQPKDKREEKELQREQGAKYSAQTGRLIPPPTRATSHRIPYQTRGKAARRKYGGPQAFILEDQELLVLELLCQILQTDCLTSIQLWLLGAPQKEKELAIRLLNTAVAQLPSPPSVSLLEEKLLSQLQEVQEQKRNLLTSYSLSQKKLPPLQRSEKPEYLGKAQVLRMPLQHCPEEKVVLPKT
ncbi:protein TBATA [Suncus etruscus]|uniref:protein TBATA n=1 Tax=Suncus etruscus TaxID=109475 RepID=UPI0021109894|nr:protein TBATA [Suncus etruscus]